MGGGEAFCGPVVRAQALSEPRPLGCELHKCFSVFPPNLSRTGRLEWAGVGYFSSATWKARGYWSWVFPCPGSVKLYSARAGQALVG